MRGELAARSGEPAPLVSTRLRASIFWLGRTPLAPGRDYHLRLGTARVPMRVESVERVLDASTLDERKLASTLDERMLASTLDERMLASTLEAVTRTEVLRNDVADVVLKLDRALAFDRHADLAATGRFVIVDDHEIRGGGIVREALVDGDEAARDRVRLRNLKWEHSRIAPDVRAARAGQRPTLIFVTGEPEIDRKGVAKHLEARLFADGRAAYYLGMANMLYGVDADLDRTLAQRHEHFRRLGEIAHLMLDAGLIFVVSAADLGPDDLEIVKMSVSAEQIRTVWVGPARAARVDCDVVVPDTDAEAACDAIVRQLAAHGVVPRV
jgi:bifunctional enzyme CysN/CysC